MLAFHKKGNSQILIDITEGLKKKDVQLKYDEKHLIGELLFRNGIFSATRLFTFQHF